MTRVRRIWVRVAAPVVLIGGVAVATAAKRAHVMKDSLATWADSLEHGAGPLTLGVRFVPMFVDGQRLGLVRTLHIMRHDVGGVDSVRLDVDPRSKAAAARLADCELLITSFDPEDFKRAMTCVGETDDEVRFGSVLLGSEGPSVPIYVSQLEHACAPWNKDRESCRTARAALKAEVDADVARIRVDVEQIRREVQQQVREQVRDIQQVAPPPPPR